MKTAHAVAVVLVLAACTDRATERSPAAPPVEPPPQTVTYACEGGVGAEASYGADGALTLTVGDETWPMNPADATSGSRWIGETLEWWVTLEGGQEAATLRQLNAQRIGEAVVARCRRPTSGGVLAPEPPAQQTPAQTPVATAGEPCPSASLSLAAVSADAAAGSRFNVLAFTNQGARACTLQGYPALQLIGDDGQVRSGFTIHREPGPYYGEGDTITAVTLAPGARAYFDLVSTVIAGEVAGETEPCAPVIAVRASPAEGQPAVQAPVQLTPCNQRVRVTPFRPTEDTARAG